jgi:DHA2 family multidrug resistance protein-like MFS transporter
VTRNAAAVVSSRATSREWLGLAVLALPCLLYSMDLTVLHLAVPRISADLRPTSAELLWIIDIYGFFVAGCLITMGTLGDRIGRRKLLLIGAAAFGVASILAAFSHTTPMLIASRAVLGVAGATLAPSTLSLVRNMFLDERQRTTAIAVIITSYSVGGAIGPLVGGALLEVFWWGSVFLISVPVMALLLGLGPRLLPEYRDETAGRPDMASAALSLGAVLLVIFGLKQTAQDGVSAVPTAAVVVGLALGAAFIRRQLRLAYPFIDLRLFRVPAFSASIATYALVILVLFGGFLFLPQYLQLVLGLSPLEAGLWSLPWALSFVVGSMLTPRVARRVRPAFVMAGGLVVAAVGFAVLTQVTASTSLVVTAVASAVFALGTSPVFTLTNDVILGAAPPERAGAAAGLSETGAELAGALGISVFGSLGVAIYRHTLVALAPAGLPPDAAEAARGTLGAAIAVAAQLPEQVAMPLVAAARTAFVDGFHVAAAVSSVGAIALALFVGLTLRHVREPAPVPAADRAAPRLRAEPGCERSLWRVNAERA